jgi:hypothetical protein|nr:MAG TPA: hypothetical protein [Caudoviricetes sp.]
MVSISILIIAIIAIIIAIFIVTFLHYLLHRYVNKDTICYYDDKIYLLNQDTTDLILNITDDKPSYYPYIEIYTYDLDNYKNYLKYYLFPKYIKNISE